MIVADKDWRKWRVAERCELVLFAVARFRKLHPDYGPTLDEIRKETAIPSKSSVDGYLDRLRLEGLVKFDDRIARSIQLTDSGWARVR